MSRTTTLLHHVHTVAELFLNHREDAALRIVDWLECQVRHRYIDRATRAQPLETTE